MILSAGIWNDELESFLENLNFIQHILFRKTGLCIIYEGKASIKKYLKLSMFYGWKQT